MIRVNRRIGFRMELTAVVVNAEIDSLSFADPRSGRNSLTSW